MIPLRKQKKRSYKRDSVSYKRGRVCYRRNIGNYKSINTSKKKEQLPKSQLERTRKRSESLICNLAWVPTKFFLEEEGLSLKHL